MKIKGILVASAALGLMAGGATVVGASHHEGGEIVKCSGINSCKGHGECGASDGSHECSGKNSCKGKGWISVSAEECEAKGGTVVE